jgi:hypothetical protein
MSSKFSANSSAFVMMWACTRIRALARRANRRETGAQKPRGLLPSWEEVDGLSISGGELWVESTMIERFRTLWLPIRVLLGLLLGLTSIIPIILLAALIFSPLYLPYWRAIGDAYHPTGREISADLIAIPEDDSLVWKGEPDDRRLLVVTWASKDESFHTGDEGDS